MNGQTKARQPGKAEAESSEAALRESELRFRMVADFTFDWEFWTDPEGRFVYVSPSCERITGHKAEEFLADPDLNRRLVHPDDLDRFDRHVCNVRENRCAGFGEWRVLHADGTYRWVEHACQPVFDEGGHYRGVRGSNRDITDRKQAEEALRRLNAELESRVAERTAQLAAAEASFRSLVENTLDIPCRVSATGAILYIGPQIRSYGFEPDQLVGRNFLDVLHPDDRDRMLADFTGTLASGQASPSEFRIKSPDGSIHWVEERSGIHLDSVGAVTGFTGVLRDITERKRVEAVLRESEEQFRVMFETAAVGIGETDPQTGRFLRVNQKMCAITGYSLGELTGMSIPDITHPDDRQRDWDMFQRVIRGEQASYHIEKRYVRKDGLLAWVNINMTVIRNAAGKPVRTMATIEDITERKQTEERLRLEDAALAAAANGIAIVGRDGNIVWVNEAFTALTGYSPDEVRGRNPRVLRSGIHGAAFYKELWDTILAGKVWRSELVNRHKTGRLYTEDMTITPVRDTSGTITHFIAIKQDVTARKLLEQEMMSAVEREQERIGRDLHDGICQILTGAKFKTALLGQKLQGWSPLSEAGDALAIETLIDQAIEQARGMAHGLNPVRSDPGGLQMALEQLAASVATETGPRCTCHIPHQVRITEHFVAMHLYRIAQEAVQNAIKHGRARNIAIQLKQRAGRVRIITLSITDDGIGAGQHEDSPAGIGLSNMRTRAAMIGGRLEINSTTDQGTTVICRVQRLEPTGARHP